MLDKEEEWVAWLRFSLQDKLTYVQKMALLKAFGPPQVIYDATKEQLKKHLPSAQASALCEDVSPQEKVLIDRTRRWLENTNNQIITLANPTYPVSLLNVTEPPILLYVSGNIALLEQNAIAIMGSREATSEACRDAKGIAKILAEQGVTIVSGATAGISLAAHAGALKEKGSTVAVLGTGVDIFYPQKAKALLTEISRLGCLISEVPLGSEPQSLAFERRNRLITGLSKGLLVVQATLQSSVMKVAQLALEQGRDVLAMPGSIHSPLSRGCHRLIRQGAKLVETAQDVLEEIRPVLVVKSNKIKEK